jgi:hypothetical protein
MNQSFGSWMLTGGVRGELHREARQLEHLAVVRELRAERSAARRAARNAALAEAVSGLRARFAGSPTQITPDRCPA